MMTNNNKPQYLDFDSYERVAEPHKREKASTWRMAIGLQDVDVNVLFSAHDRSNRL